MAKHLIENTLSLLGGAGLGAALMYLFDPDLGGDRRQDVRSAAGQALSSTSEALHSTAHTAGESARSFAHRVSDYAHGMADDAGSRASGMASDLSDRATGFAADAVGSARERIRGAASDLADRARERRDDLADRAGALWSRTRRSVAGQESHPVALAGGITAGTVGLLAIGAGVMYFYDPQRGRGRRAWARDKVFSASRRAGRQARSLGRHLGNQMQGVAHEAGRMMPESWTDGSGGEQSSSMSDNEASMPSASASPEVGRM